MLSTLAGCGKEAEAKKYISDLTRDPSAVQFRNIVTKFDKNGKLICGEFNETNQFGGYEGFTKFAYDPSTKQLILPDPPLLPPPSFQPTISRPSGLTREEAREFQWLTLIERTYELCLEAKQ
jgi:hypothetical protein